MSRQRYLQEIDKLKPAVKRSFLNWVKQRVKFANIREAERFVESGQIDELMRAVGITETSLSAFAETIRTVYAEAGSFEAPAVQISFNMSNPAAELWLRQNSSRLVTAIMESQRQAIREVLEYGASAGRNPRQTALDIAGRMGSAGRRTGGIVGLSQPQAAYVVNARRELRSGDPAQLQQYLTRQRRDRTYDSAVRRAIASSSPLPQTTVDRIAGRYSDRLLQLRGETIARTETIHALNAARDQAWDQAIDEGLLDRRSVVSIWSASGDLRTREDHRDMNRQQRPQGQPFQSPTGAYMMYPGDTSLGARGEDVINCRCHLIKRADFIGEALRRNPRRRRASSG